MKSKLAGIILFMIIGAIPAQTQQPGRWEILFDGKSTDAWRGFKQNFFPREGWAIKNGALKTIVGGKRVDLITKDKYRNFELELEWRVSPGGNSGVIYKVSEEFEQAWNTGPEMQVLDDEKHPDGKNPKTAAGALYALIAPTSRAVRPVGQWNKARLVVNNNQVEHWLNGKKIIAYEWGSDALQKLISASKFKEYPRFAQEQEGHIALQHHGEEVWYRNIKIRTLRPGEQSRR